MLTTEGSGVVAVLGAGILLLAYVLSGGVVFLALAFALTAVWGTQLWQRSGSTRMAGRTRR